MSINDDMQMPPVSEIGLIAREAGAGILKIYESGNIGLETKDDESPLTKADLFSNELILSRLEGLSPDIPVISEEGKSIPFDVRAEWRQFFLVDPLDGTKSFVKRNGEFTVNIALVEDGVPVMGVIYSPLSDTLYFAQKGRGAYRRKGLDSPVRIMASDPRGLEGIVTVASLSHRSESLEEFLKADIFGQSVSASSSLKFCLVAEGRADLYPRFTPLWEWDTAAGHAILLEAGGRVMDASGQKELAYNKESLLHDGLLALPRWILEDIRPYLVGIV